MWYLAQYDQMWQKSKLSKLAGKIHIKRMGNGMNESLCGLQSPTFMLTSIRPDGPICQSCRRLESNKKLLSQKD